MKEKLKNSYKPAPDRFRFAVTSAVREAVQSVSAPVKKRIPKYARVLIAAALILAIVPTAVFGASKLISLLAQPVDNYGLELKSETVSYDYPEYVKMRVDVPDGFIVEPGTDGLKYSEANGGEGAFSLCPMRGNDNTDAEVIGRVDSYEEIILCGRTAYRVKMSGSGFDRVYISYPEVNVVLLIYYDSVTAEQLEAFVSGISFAAGSAADHTELFEMFDERVEDKVQYTFGYTSIEYPRDTVMTFSGYSEQNGDESLRYSAQITGVRITDSIIGLDSSRFNQMYVEQGIADSSGRLLPRTVTVTKAGDGFNTSDEVLSREDKEQKLVLVDLTYTNLSGEDTTVYIPYILEAFVKNADGEYDCAWNIDPENKITSTELCDSEPMYVSDPLDAEHSFYCTSLKANETKTVTIGFRCVAEELDKAYLTIYDAASEGVVDPAPEGFDGRDSIPNYIIKVQ